MASSWVGVLKQASNLLTARLAVPSRRGGVSVFHSFTTYYVTPRKKFDSSVDIHESEENFLVMVEVPGVKKENVNVTTGIEHIKRKSLFVKAPGDMFRNPCDVEIELPDEVDMDRVKEAKLYNGMLVVTIPKIKSNLGGENVEEA